LLNNEVQEKTNRSAVSRIEQWFERWHLADMSRLTKEDAKKALEELELLVEEYLIAT
jgi:hypothetical protein